MPLMSESLRRIVKKQIYRIMEFFDENDDPVLVIKFLLEEVPLYKSIYYGIGQDEMGNYVKIYFPKKLTKILEHGELPSQYTVGGIQK